VLGFLNGGDIREEINDTPINLIPKVRNPQSIKQYITISIVYKSATKSVANRMRPLLEYTISSAFVAGRLISDNALVAERHEHTHIWLFQPVSPVNTWAGEDPTGRNWETYAKPAQRTLTNLSIISLYFQAKPFVVLPCSVSPSL
jgi:hypothetical protein